MDIQNYLNSTRILRKNIPIHENQSYIQLFKSMGRTIGDQDLNVLEVYSSKIMPEIITINNSEYLIWDSHLIDILHGLYNILGLFSYTSNLDEKHQDRQKIIDSTSCALKASMFNYLSWKLLKYPKISLAFAFNYRKYKMVSYKFNDPSEKINTYINQQFHIIKLFIFFHEQYHYYYKINKDALRDRTRNIIKIFQIQLHPAISMKTNKSSQDVMTLSFIESLISGNYPQIVEEILCDWSSFLQIWECLKVELGTSDKDKLLELLSFITMTINTLVNFLSRMRSLASLWDGLANEINDGEFIPDNLDNLINKYEKLLYYDLLRLQFINLKPIIDIIHYDKKFELYDKINLANKFKQIGDNWVVFDKVFRDYVDVQINKMFLGPKLIKEIFETVIEIKYNNTYSTEYIQSQRNLLLEWDTM